MYRIIVIINILFLWTLFANAQEPLTRGDEDPQITGAYNAFFSSSIWQKVNEKWKGEKRLAQVITKEGEILSVQLLTLEMPEGQLVGWNHTSPYHPRFENQHQIFIPLDQVEQIRFARQKGFKKGFWIGFLGVAVPLGVGGAYLEAEDRGLGVDPTTPIIAGSILGGLAGLVTGGLGALITSPGKISLAKFASNPKKAANIIKRKSLFPEGIPAKVAMPAGQAFDAVWEYEQILKQSPKLRVRIWVNRLRK